MTDRLWGAKRPFIRKQHPETAYQFGIGALALGALGVV